jgi:alpha-L-fucosidase
MYNTSLSRWNAVAMGPKRDIIGELSEAVRKEGLIFGLSSHRIEHFWFMNNGRKTNSDVNDPQYEDFYGPAVAMNPFMSENRVPLSIEYMNDWLLRCTELVDKYHPQVFWFDWYIGQPEMEPYRKSFAAYYYNHACQWGKGVVLNYKDLAYPENVAVYDIERGSSRATKKYPWQTDTSIGEKSWGYIDGEVNKSPDKLIDLLIDIVSKNGNLLLNIGPRADGTITDEQTRVLLAMGKWLDINGEGIFGTRPWIIAEEGPTQAVEGSFSEYNQTAYSAKDIRFTSKGNVIYAFTLDIPAGKNITIASLSQSNLSGKNISAIELLGNSEKINWKQQSQGLVIKIPSALTGEYALCFKITLSE